MFMVTPCYRGVYFSNREVSKYTYHAVRHFDSSIRHPSARYARRCAHALRVDNYCIQAPTCDLFLEGWMCSSKTITLTCFRLNFMRFRTVGSEDHGPPSWRIGALDALHFAPLNVFKCCEEATAEPSKSNPTDRGKKPFPGTLSSRLACERGCNRRMRSALTCVGDMLTSFTDQISSFASKMVQGFGFMFRA